MLINAIGARYMMRGDLARAIRAAELRLRLPLADDARDRHAAELTSLRALLTERVPGTVARADSAR